MHLGEEEGGREQTGRNDGGYWNSHGSIIYYGSGLERMLAGSELLQTCRLLQDAVPRVGRRNVHTLKRPGMEWGRFLVCTSDWALLAMDARVVFSVLTLFSRVQIVLSKPAEKPAPP